MKSELRVPKFVNIWLVSVGPVAVGASAALSIFFLVSTTWKEAFAVLVVPPTLLYLWVALTYWFGHSRVNKADKLATMTATTGIYLLLFPFCGFVSSGGYDRTLGVLTLLAIMSGAFEIRRWRRRVSYPALGVLLGTLGATLLLRRVYGPPILYLAPAILLQQALVLVAVSLPAELFQGGAGDPPAAPNEDTRTVPA